MRVQAYNTVNFKRALFYTNIKSNFNIAMLTHLNLLK